MDRSEANKLYALVTAGLLMTRKEYRLAIPYCEQAIQLLSGQNEPLALGLIGLTAALLPARRAASIEPMEALRED